MPPDAAHAVALGIDGCGAFRSGEGVEMFCPKCGAENPGGAKFCVKCGAELPVVQKVEPVAAESSAAAEKAADASGTTSAPGGVDAAAPVASVEAPAHAGDTAAAAPGVASTGTRIATPASVPAPRKKSPLPLVIAGVVVVALVAVAIFVVMNLFGGEKETVEQKANASTLAYGISSAGGYDYFYSAEMEAICRAKPGSEVEKVLPVPNDTSMGYSRPEFYVMGVAADGDSVFYTVLGYEPETYDSYLQLRCVNADGSDDRLLKEFEQGDDTYVSLGSLYAYDGRAYLAVTESNGYGNGKTEVISIDAAGADERVECTMESSYTQYVVLPDKIYYTEQEYGYSDSDLGFAAIYVRNIDGSGSERIYSVDGGSISSLALVGDKIVCREYNYSTEAQRIVSIDIETGDTETLYRPEDGYSAVLLAVSDDTAYLERYASDTYDISRWDLIAVPLSGGEPVELVVGMDYYNASGAVMNGHLLLTENGQDIGSVAMRAMAIDLKTGEVLEEYIS